MVISRGFTALFGHDLYQTLRIWLCSVRGIHRGYLLIHVKKHTPSEPVEKDDPSKPRLERKKPGGR